MRARLVVEEGEGTRRVLELVPGRGEYTVGRSRDCSLVVRDELVSRTHARIAFEGGRWTWESVGRNGTTIDLKLHRSGAVPLRDGTALVVGDTPLRFEADGTWPDAAEPDSFVTGVPVSLCLEELRAAVAFTTAAAGITDGQTLLRVALDAVIRHTHAGIAAYLTLDAAPLTKLVRPDHAAIDAGQGRALSERVRASGATVWLGRELSDRNTTETLLPFTDALCVPVAVGGEPAGALHAYRANDYFLERDALFVEAVAGYLGPALAACRRHRSAAAEVARFRGRDADALLGDSPAAAALRIRIAAVAATLTPALVRGPAGAGKTLAAVRLHREGHRAAGPLVVVDCREADYAAALADHFAAADDGTLVFAEVGDLPAAAQPKLLRAITGRAFPADVRVVATTSRDLAAEPFLPDLLAQLAANTVEVPPLRDRADDIPALAAHFLARLTPAPRLTEAAVARLRAYHWPGNVRQLRATLDHAALTAAHDEIDAGDLLLASPKLEPSSHTVNLEDLERWAVAEALRRTKGNKSAAAEMLGIGRDTLGNKVKRYGVDGG